MPTTSEMRNDLYKVYHYKPGWVHKVNLMSHSQLFAVWHRFAENNFDPERIKKDGAKSITSQKRIAAAVEHMPVANIKHTTYLCNDCRGWFVADNPDIHECRFCGSEMIQKGAYIYEN